MRGLRGLDGALAAAIDDVASRLGMDPAWLRAIIEFETGGTFSPSVRNAQSGAVGLIQFMPATAAGLGTSTAALAQMSGPEQMEYVYRYFQPYAGSIYSVEDAYMAVLWPRAIGQASDYVLFAAPSIQYQQNAGLDRSGSGRVTKADAAARVVALAGQAPEPATFAAGGGAPPDDDQKKTLLMAAAVVGGVALLLLVLD